MNVDLLRQDHATLTEIFTARRSVSADTLPIGLRMVWQIYLTILEDALKTLDSLIQSLDPKRGAL